ncbi:MAG: hypothetical protein ACXWUL_10690 [Caldimonas sp.]
MKRLTARATALAVAVAMAAAPAPSEAIAPVLLVFVKQLAKDAAQSILKDLLLSSLRDMGCKGIALANAFEAFDLRRKAGGAGMFAGGLPTLPGGTALPQLPGDMVLPQVPGGMVLPQMPGGLALAPGLGGTAGMPPEMMAKMREMMPGAGSIPEGSGIDAEQMQRVLQAMSRPLSPPQTLAVIDEMAEVGLLPKAMQAELKECMLVLPAAAPALGMGMAMLQPMLPQLRQAREEMRALSPAEQDEVAAALLQELAPLPADERKSFVEFVDNGFFPRRIADAVKAGLSAR